MKDYRVIIRINKSAMSFVEAMSAKEAGEKALEEWMGEFGGFGKEDLDIAVEELYNDDIEF